METIGPTPTFAAFARVSASLPRPSSGLGGLGV